MASFVLLQITNTKSVINSEKRFDRSILITELKGKLELITGITSTYMKLELYNGDKNLVSVLDDDKVLGYYSPQDNYRLHVIDQNPSSQVGEFDDLSKVEKYEISSEDYDKKEDSVRNFMKRNKMGKYSDDAKLAEEKLKLKEANEENRAKSFNMGDRCETSVPKQPKRRGIIMYKGVVEFQPGWWIGVKYDEPLGKNDGSVKGKRYFTCDPKYGGFVRPSQVEVGDFPEEDLELTDEDEM